MIPDFVPASEVELGRRFLDSGHVVIEAENADCLAAIRDCVVGAAAKFLGIAAPADRAAFLNGIGAHVAVARLNDLRLAVLNHMAAQDWLRRAYYALARDALAALVGNELVMQRRVNLSVQLPDDSSSLLPVHADVWDGDSPFEVVLW
ncbi:MAG: hypothetical protein VW644_07705, partial [Alphaproteobacteria bacterium]